VLTRSEQNRVAEAIVAGASGYILKSAPPQEIIAAIRATAAGECVLSPQIAGKLLQRIRERDIPVTATSECAALAIRASLSSVSANTVSNHIASILAKLHLDNRIQAAVHAVRTGIS
jgi:DNA-binding NarL/FixJ family response regulator